MIRQMKKTHKNRITGDSEESKNTRFRIELLAIIRVGRWLIWFTVSLVTLYFAWKSS